MAMTRSVFYVLSRLLPLLVIFTLVSARKHTLKLTYDHRSLVTLTSFGFREKGYLAVKISDISFPGNDSNTYGLTLDKSVRSQSEFFSTWESKEKCPLAITTDTSASIVFFRVEFKNKVPMRMRIIRNGDLKNLTITLDDKISDNSTANEKSIIKRSTYKFPLSTSARNKRAAVEAIAKVNNASAAAAASTAAPTVAEAAAAAELDLVSVDVVPLTAVRIENEVHYEAHFTVWITDAKDAGLYNLAFHNCRQFMVNLTVEMAENNNGNYLSVGQMPLPVMYFVLSVVYFAVGSIWFYILCSAKDGVFKIHYLMLALMYIKSTSLLFHGVNYHFIEAKGQKEEAFAILFYIVYLMRGIFMFATIVLIGAGWTFVKHILSDRDKKIFVIVIPLQILTNVATIILSESEEGQSTYTTWRDIFLLVDLLCCGAILFPVVWSIRHLQQASQTDGKAAVNLEKLKIFRHFYILVVCYIYFTRIIVLLLSITVPFRYEWLDECFVEVATLIFFMMTGYKFRPASNNPYLQVPQSDDEMEMEAVTQSGALEGVVRVNVKTKNKESEEPLLKQRENSHEYD